MTRLFISLYLFIAFSLVGLSAGLDRLFWDRDDALTSEQQAWLRSFEAMRQQSDSLHRFLAISKLDYTVDSTNEVALANSIRQQIDQQSIFHGFSDTQWLVYVPLANQQLATIRFPRDDLDIDNWWLYSSAFFLLLGALIAVWLYPLWRDLTRLTSATRELGDDGHLPLPHLSSRSPLRDIYRALSELSQKVIALLKNQRELTGAVTHEFRTPLARLKFALAEDSPLDSNQLGAIREDINELERLVQEMLDFTRLDIHKPELHIESIPLYELCQQRIELLSTHTQIAISITGDKPVYNADGHLISRALDNVLSNAIRYAKKCIIVRIEEDPNAISIAVDDDGEGIPSKYRDVVFKPFYRPDTARDRSSGGAGLGLAIVQRIQQWHQGDCFVADSPLKGARIVLRYPKPVE